MIPIIYQIESVVLRNHSVICYEVVYVFYLYLWPRYPVSVYNNIGPLVLVFSQNIDCVFFYSNCLN